MDEMHFDAVVKRWGDMLFRISMTMLAHSYDAEDAVQETFFRYIAKASFFQDDEHEKAWLIRVCMNICRDILRRRAHTKYINLDDLRGYGIRDEDIFVFDELMSLPVIYREVVLMHYIEGYRINDIAEILQISPSAVKKRLQYARGKLRGLIDGTDGNKEEYYAAEQSDRDDL